MEMFHVPFEEHFTTRGHNWCIISDKHKLAVGAYSEFTFKKAMQQMDKVKKGARVWLNDLGDKKKWNKHKFDPISFKCDVNKTNFVETFNATFGVDRCRPILTLLEGIRRSCMVRMAIRQENCETWARQDICPNIIKKCKLSAKNEGFAEPTLVAKVIMKLKMVIQHWL